MTALPKDVVADLRRRVAELEQQLQSSAAERDEAIAQQAATAEILQIINSSPADLAPVFEAILDRALRPCEAHVGVFWTYDGELMRASAIRGAPRAYVEFLQRGPHRPSHVQLRLLGGTEGFVQIADLTHSEGYRNGEPLPRAAADLGGIRTLLVVPLRRHGAVLGTFGIYRQEVRPFTDRQIALVESFAAQAVIAMENARLFNKTKEALERQNASADILRTIASTPGDAGRSLKQIAETSARLFGAPSVSIQLVEDGKWADAYRLGDSAQRIRAAVPLASIRVGGRNMPGAVAGENRQIHIPDLDHLDPSMSDWPGLPHARAAGTRTICGTPLRRDGKAIGALIVYRDRLLPFTPEELALQQSFADQAVIAIENARLFNETKEALERQTATSEILRVINNSGGNLAPVFDSILENAHHLCGAPCGSLQLYERDRVVPVAIRGMTADFAGFLRAGYPITEGLREGLFADRPIQRVDLAEFLRSHPDEPSLRAGVELGGIGTMVTVPLAKNGVTFGRIVAARREVSPFNDRQIALLEGFADQAVIAIENARLFNETREALERQTATSDILKVIASSPSDVQPVFEAIAASANRLLGGFSSTVFRFIDGIAYLKAFTPTTPAADEIMQATFPRPVADFPPFQMAQAGEVTQVTDTEAFSNALPLLNIARARGYRSMLFAPLMNDGVSIGFIAVTRVQPGAFADHHVQLLRTFADQAVIAIENVRLFDEVQAKTRDLSESLQQQTAVGDVLKTISRSTFDLQPVLDTLVQTAARLCETEMAFLMRRDGDVYRAGAAVGFTEAYIEFLKNHPLAVDRGTITGRAVLERRTVQILDVATDPEYTLRESVSLSSQHTALCVPLLRENEPIGTIVLARQRVEPFTQKQIDLVTTFADQAVIAIENVRLFDQLRQRTDDLSESLQQQTATADVLKVISRSAFDLQTVLETLVRSAAELSGSKRGVIFLRDGDLFRFKAMSYADANPEWIQYLKDHPQKAGQNSAIARSIASGQIVYVPDVLADPQIDMPATALAGIRAVLAVPLLRDGKVEGIMALSRSTPGTFDARQIDLVQTFADQAVIAIENVRLFDEVQARTRELSEALTYQTGSSNILGVIASSPTDVGPVLKAIVESARELCEADDALVVLKDGNDLVFKEQHGSLPVVWRRLPINRNWATGRTVVDGIPVHVHDLLSAEGDEFPEGRDIARRDNVRTILTIPLLREQQSIGAIVLRRTEVHPFSDKQIALLQTFADQAVIAIGNVRLFEEVQARTRDLSESAAANRDCRRAQGHQPLGVRFASRAANAR
jgi:GAF domain-containing protein